MTTTPYPCDRSTGMPVGYHLFQMTEYGTCCQFCGAVEMSKERQLRQLKQEHQALENAQAIQRVREMHGPIDIDGDLECRECPMSAYPCRTLRALDGEQE